MPIKQPLSEAADQLRDQEKAACADCWAWRNFIVRIGLPQAWSRRLQNQPIIALLALDGRCASRIGVVCRMNKYHFQKQSEKSQLGPKHSGKGPIAHDVTRNFVALSRNMTHLNHLFRQLLREAELLGQLRNFSKYFWNFTFTICASCLCRVYKALPGLPPRLRCAQCGE